MRILLRQKLTLEGRTYAAGEVADLPQPLAITLLRRGIADPVKREPEAARPNRRKQRTK